MGEFKCLGIESSCDETSAAVVAGGIDILSNVVYSQVALHAPFRGVVPEIACRAHVETIISIIDRSLSDANLTLGEIDAIAVTHTPGLVGALLVGISAAKAIAFATGKPLIGVDHICAHIYASKLAYPDLSYPCISMVVSGGHTSLYLSASETDHRPLGATRDDAAGEAFDKVAKMLDLPFPGGPNVELCAKDGNPAAIKFARTYLEEGTLDFSFSGVKTSVLYHLRGQNCEDGKKRLSGRELADIAASFQEAVVDVLVEKAIAAARRFSVPLITVGGGVACNGRLRDLLQARASKSGIRCLFPPGKLCTDNGAMVAGIAYHQWRKGETSDLSLDALPTKLHAPAVGT